MSLEEQKEKLSVKIDEQKVKHEEKKHKLKLIVKKENLN